MKNQNVTITDKNNGRSPRISFMDDLRTTKIVRLCGTNFMGTTLDTNFWTDGSANSGSLTQVSGMVTLATNTTANGAAKITSVRKGRFMFACPNIFRAAVRLVTAGTTNNKRKWGAYDGSDGYYFQLNGSTFSIGYQSAGAAETLINNGSFNGVSSSWTVDANVHTFEIHYFVMRVEFYIDGVLIHTLVPTTAFITGVLTLPIWCENTNSSSSTTAVTMELWNASILRLGDESHSPISKNITGAATTVLKRGSGKIHELSVNSTSAGTVTIYDNTAASGTILATITTNNTAGGSWDLNFVFFIGLTIVTSAAGHDITANYE